MLASTLFAALALAATATAAPMEARDSAGTIIQPMNHRGKCLDVPSANFYNGAKLQLWDCNSSNAQLFAITGGQGSGKIQFAKATNWCLNAGTSNGADLTVVPCSSAPNWQYNSADASLTRNGYAIDLPDGNANNGQRIQVWQHYTNSANQAWFFKSFGN